MHVGRLPLSGDSPPSRYSTDKVESSGLNATFDERIHLLSAEPNQTFLRVSVTDSEEEVAYETAVVGRLRRGYRVFRLRCELGTQIEHCYLLVHISFGKEANFWIPPRELRQRLSRQHSIGNMPTGLLEETSVGASSFQQGEVSTPVSSLGATSEGKSTTVSMSEPHHRANPEGKRRTVSILEPQKLQSAHQGREEEAQGGQRPVLADRQPSKQWYI